MESIIKAEVGGLEGRIEAKLAAAAAVAPMLAAQCVAGGVSQATAIHEPAALAPATQPPAREGENRSTCSMSTEALPPKATASGATPADSRASEINRTRHQRHRCEHILKKFHTDAVFGTKNTAMEGGGDVTERTTRPDFLEQRRRRNNFDIQDGHRLPWGVLHPNGGLRQSWDAIAITLVLWLALSLPYRIAFVDTADPATLVAFDVFIDFFFLADIVLNATTAYTVEDHLFYGRRQILVNYARTWLPIDIIASFPVEWCFGFPPGSNTSVGIANASSPGDETLDELTGGAELIGIL